MKNKLLASLFCFSSILLAGCSFGNSNTNNSSSSTNKQSLSSNKTTSNSSSSSSSSSSSTNIKESYTISFITNSTQIIEQLIYEEEQTVYLEDLPVLVDRSNLEAPKFVCWTNNNEDVLQDFSMPSQNIELVAKWRAYETWTVKYETNIDGYTIDDTVISENYGLESFSLPKFTYPYRHLNGWFYDSTFENEVGATLDESRFNNKELTLYAKTEETDVSAADSWAHVGNDYIGRGYTQVKNVNPVFNKTISLTVNLPAYNKEEGCYGTTEIYFGGNDELIENGTVKSGYALFICGLDDNSAPVNDYVDPRAGSMALYKINNSTGAREMVAACRRYVEPFLSSEYNTAYQSYISNGETLQFEMKFIFGEEESYITVMGTQLFVFDYNPDGNGFGFYTNASFPTAAYFSSLTTKESGSTTISFNVDGGNEIIDNMSIKYGNKLGTLPVATKDDYTFQGWLLNGNLVDENYVPGLVNNLELKASWSEKALVYDVWDGTVASSITNGSGTETDPYIVNTGAELAFISSKVKAEDSNYKRAYYKLGNNIDLNDIEWTPIGSSNANPFQGTFDGNDKVIIGMKISKGAAVGLFGHIADAYISNIDLTANVTPTAVNGGILVGRAQPSTISNCIVRGTLTSNSQYVGGIVPTVNAYDASVSGTQTKMVIKNCTNYATITTTTTQTNNFIGGIVAQSVETVALELDGCVNRGNVTGTNSYVAGIISIARKNESSIVKNCYNYGDITSGSKSRMTGGIAGASRCRFENCYGYELAKVNNIAGNNATAKLYPETNGTTVPGAIICGQWDAVANCTSNSGFFNCGMCDVDGNPVAK